MAEKTLASEYALARKKYPGLPAKQAVLIARGRLRPLEFEWEDGYRSLVTLSAKTEREGFDIELVVAYEQYPVHEYDETSDDTGIRNPHFRWNGEQYGVRHKRFIALESGNTVRELAEYYNKAGASRNVAWEDARESLAKEAEWVTDEQYTEYVLTAKASVDGIELGSASTGGFDIGPDVWGEELQREVESGFVDTGLIEEAIEEARENLASVIAKEQARLARMVALTPLPEGVRL